MRNASSIASTIRYNCEVNDTSNRGMLAGTSWIVDVTYSMPEGTAYIEKHLDLCRAGTGVIGCDKSWKATVRSVELWRRLVLTGGKSEYTGRLASEPRKSDFHPTNASNKDSSYAVSSVI
jgi:hypothetical protein